MSQYTSLFNLSSFQGDQLAVSQIVDTGTDDATSTTTGAFQCAGGIGLAKSLYVGGSLTALGSVNCGSVISSGSVGATGNIQSHGNITSTGDITGNGNIHAGTDLSATGNLNVNGTMFCTGSLTASNSITSTGSSAKFVCNNSQAAQYVDIAQYWASGITPSGTNPAQSLLTVGKSNATYNGFQFRYQHVGNSLGTNGLYLSAIGQGTPTLYVEADSKVGINTSSPLYTLDVAGAINSTQNVSIGGACIVSGAINTSDFLTASGAYSKLLVNYTTGVTYQDIAQFFVPNVNNNGQVILTVGKTNVGSYNAFQFRHNHVSDGNGANGMLLAACGQGTNTFYVQANPSRIGINTSSPAYTLDVAGPLRSTGAITGDSLQVTNGITGGTMSATALTCSGTISATALTCSGTMSATALTCSGTMTASALTCSGTMSATALTCSGTMSASALTCASNSISSSLTCSGTTNLGTTYTTVLKPTDVIPDGNITMKPAQYIYTNNLYPISPATQIAFSNISCGNINAYTNLITCGTLSTTGDITCGGLKSFMIPHPTKPGYRLRHCAVETDSCGDNLYRYQVIITVPLEPFDVPMENYFAALNTNVQTWISACNGFGQAYAVMSADNTICTVTANAVGTYNLLVIGTRMDPGSQSFYLTGGVEYAL